MKNSFVLCDQLAVRVGSKTQRGSVKFGWVTASVRRDPFKRRNPNEKFPLGSVRSGWKESMDESGLASKPLVNSRTGSVALT